MHSTLAGYTDQDSVVEVQPGEPAPAAPQTAPGTPGPTPLPPAAPGVLGVAAVGLDGTPVMPAATAATPTAVKTLCRPEFPPTSLGLQPAFPAELGDELGGQVCGLGGLGA